MNIISYMSMSYIVLVVEKSFLNKKKINTLLLLLLLPSYPPQYTRCILVTLKLCGYGRLPCRVSLFIVPITVWMALTTIYKNVSRIGPSSAIYCTSLHDTGRRRSRNVPDDYQTSIIIRYSYCLYNHSRITHYYFSSYRISSHIINAYLQLPFVISAITSHISQTFFFYFCLLFSTAILRDSSLALQNTLYACSLLGLPHDTQFILIFATSYERLSNDTGSYTQTNTCRWQIFRFITTLLNTVN